MIYPPLAYQPGELAPQNGRPTYAKDAQSLDRYTAWLAAVRRAALPRIVGAPLTSAVAHQWTLEIPAYVPHLAVGLLVDGHGDLRLTSTTDPWYAEIAGLAYGTGLAWSYAAAQWVWCDLAIDGVGADGLQRALDVGLLSAPQQITLGLTIIDAPGPIAAFGLRVYEACWVPLVADETAVLPP